MGIDAQRTTRGCTGRHHRASSQNILQIAIIIATVIATAVATIVATAVAVIAVSPTAVLVIVPTVPPIIIIAPRSVAIHARVPNALPEAGDTARSGVRFWMT